MLLPVLTGISLAAPAHAEVRASSDNGFQIYHVAEVAVPPATVWKRLTTPKDWWSPDHSWSGSTAGFYMDSKAGGCFCELIQEKNKAGKTVTVGSVEHMRIIFYSPGKVLRMQGGLGPLQGEAVLGTLTVAMEPLKDATATKLSFSYTVGGYMRQKVSSLGGAVDGVLGEQFKRLIEPFVGTATASENKDEWTLDVDSITDAPADGVKPEVEETPPAEPPAADSRSKVVVKDMLDEQPIPAMDAEDPR